MMNKNVLVDGNNLLHRAYAVFVMNKTDDPMMYGGYPTGLIYGVLSMLSDWMFSMDDHDRLVFFLDGIPKRRRDMDPEYKVKDSTPQLWDNVGKKLADGYDAANQLDVLLHLLMLLGFDIIFGQEEEADDLIASFVFSHSSDLNVVVSPDQDFYQLVGENNVILYRPGIKGDRFFDAERVEQSMYDKYKIRLKPSGIRMFKSLTGDVSDNIKGVPRLRKKVAAPLCSCRSVDELFDTGLPGFSKAEKANANALKDRIALNYELVGLVCDIDVDKFTLKAEPDHDRAFKILSSDFGMASLPIHAFESSKSRSVRIGDPGRVDSLFDDI